MLLGSFHNKGPGKRQEEDNTVKDGSDLCKEILGKVVGNKSETLSTMTVALTGFADGLRGEIRQPSRGCTRAVGNG